MKKIFYFAAMMALCLSCTKEQQGGSDVIEGDVDSGEVVTATEFSAEFSQEGISKTHLGTLSDGAYPNYWSVGDCINVNGSVSAALGSEYSTNSKTARFLFDNAVSQYGGYWYIGYPGGAFTSFSSGTGTVVVPSSQTYTAGTYDPEAFVMIGKANGKSVKFYPKMGIVRITATDAATPYSYKISKVRLEAIGGESLSGTFTTNYNNASATFTSTSGNSYVDINAPTSAGLDFGSTFFFAVPIGTYAGGLRFTIYTKDDKSMSFSNSSSIEVGAGPMKNITSPAYVPSEITLSCTFKTSSSAAFEWTASNSSNNVKKVWRLAIYSDSGCNTLVVQHDIPADETSSGIWKDQGGTPRFILGGLSPGTNYWCKVTDLANGVSKVLAFTTDSFTPVSASSPSGTTLVAEDFSEIGWGSAFLGGYTGHRYAGWAPVYAASAKNAISFAAPTGVVSEGYYNSYEFAVNNLNTNLNYDTVTRLRDGWGWLWEGGFNGYPQPGFLRMGGKNANRSFVVVPALAITSGKYATVDVTVKISHMNSGDASSNPYFGVFKETSLTLSNATRREYTGAVLEHAYPLTSSNYGHNKDELTFRVNGLKNTDHLVLGLYKNVNEHNRYNLFSVTVQRVGSEYNDEIFDITDATSLELFRSRVAGGATSLKGNVINNVDASSIASSWTPIAGYTGTLEGNNKTITGLTKPFFDDLQGTVQNLTLNSTLNITSNQTNIGMFANTMTTGASLSYCIARGSVTFDAGTQGGDEHTMGGMVGHADGGSISHCDNYADVRNNTTISALEFSLGGIIGHAWTALDGSFSISNSANYADVQNAGDNTASNICVGGVIGQIGAADDSSNSPTLSISSVRNEGVASNSGDSSLSIYIGGIAGFVRYPELSGCANIGSDTLIVNSGDAVGSIFIGGLVGESTRKTTYNSSCYNSGAIKNTGGGSNLCMGGLIGQISGGANTLTGTASVYNYNSGSINESSSTSIVYVGGIVGRNNIAGTDMAYAKNLASGDIKYSDNTRSDSYIGGILGCANKTCTMDNANNAGDLIIRSITVSRQVFLGGIIGAFTFDTALTFSDCINSGKIDCVNDTNGANMAAASSSVTAMSYIGGISGVGARSNKTFLNCRNSGAIAVYNQVPVRLGGILGYSTKNPTGCVNTGPINYCRYNPQGNGTTGVVGGVVGYMGIATPHDLTNDATVRTTGSSPNCFVGGIVGQGSADTVGFENCYVGTSTGSQKTISGSGEESFTGGGAAGLFISVSSKRDWDFTGCKVKSGTKCQKITITADNLNSALVGRNQTPTNITNPPTIVSSF